MNVFLFLRHRSDLFKNIKRYEIDQLIQQSIPQQLSRNEINDIFVDLIKAYDKYGASTSDYFDYGFYRLNDLGKREFVTEKKRLALWQAFNGINYDHLFRDKLQTYEKYQKYFKRKVISFDRFSFDDILEFCSTRNAIFIKPQDSCSGIGAKHIKITNECRVREIYEEYRGKQYILEEVIEQYASLAKFHENSVNTIRINTVVTRDDVKILGAAFRIGNNGDIIDNYTTGGLITAVDEQTGVVYTRGRDVMFNWYNFHPLTMQKIIGFVIPNWDGISNFAKELAMVLPQARFVGWDIALGVDGEPLLVEGNIHSTFLQVADQVGKRQLYEEALKNW